MHKVDEDDRITILVKTGEFKNRTQKVDVSIINTDVLGDLVIISSHVGRLEEPEKLLEVFKATSNMFLVRIILHENNALMVLAERKLSTCTTEEFELIVSNVANYADGMENILFDWDLI